MDRIRLGNEEFEGRNNAYILVDGETPEVSRDGGDLVLVDTGIATPGVREDLRDGLAERGYAFADVDDIVLTHFHVDHAGLAGEIQAESDATVYVHEADAPLVAGDADTMAAVDRRRKELLEEWGVPEDARAELLEFLEAASTIEGEPADVTPIADGDVLEVGGYRLETVHAPGHAAGLCCFELDGGREAVVGDALLPVYTPNVGGADVRVDRPLAKYLTTLERLADRDYDRVWPGHRDPIEDPTARAREIIDHHRERAEKVVDVLDEHGPADAWTVSDHLFGDLEGIHILHGPGEAFAHLDHLRHEGAVTVDDGRYRLVTESVSPEEIV
ncbi:beta-lactamase domain protein [Haloterrigena turkmenica DSM 5511]|uniref:Beta-lactamase domain protein n=1 Tax=Haloterrigena turkmenica (strain ATCC 51198 / DSM 5511 / JCM 9101 / NCIMB 13204 / VKM B-1734 / 4k) TaxID=543526 RepID=D2RPH7_HALTV|nr:MBL fold metallo-hydrolase [Haloterrigena turkmenica]ADB60211.1 beta-lactamase domain protein [Haloterrigena turkmenica DSM 5511]